MDVLAIADFVLKAISAACLATLAVLGFIRKWTMDQIERESADRKKADKNIEEKQRANTDAIHEAIGKIALMQIQAFEKEREQIIAMHNMERLLKDGLHGIEVQLERIKKAE